jgi:uncharacterized protein YndB with AHSA1/START domain
MKVYDSIDIAAPPERIWPFIAEPERMAAWNEKLVSVSGMSRGPVRLGDRFDAVYQMSGKQRSATTEVVHCQPPVALTFRHSLADVSADRYVDESYELAMKASGTRVEQCVDFSQAGFPLWARAVIWFISRFGSPRGEGTLEPLKRQVESGEQQ